MARFSLNHPLSSALAPPPNETPLERKARKRAEAEARSISESIDQQIHQERIARKRRRPVKVLLVGQNENDKFALLKRLALRYGRDQWTKELLSWKAVIYLKLVRDVINVLDLLEGAMTQAGVVRPDFDGEQQCQANVYEFTDKHHFLKLHLAPLRDVQDMLEECVAVSGPSMREREFGVGVGFDGGHTKLVQQWLDDVAEVLVGCKGYMQSIWKDDVVNQILACQISKTPGFDHADIDRIASLDYVPSDNDIIETRRRTMAVQEHRFTVESYSNLANTRLDDGMEWIFYDIAGAKSSRLLWAPFFDDVDTIIFFSSISCFDERLSEDRGVNRLEDSFRFWRAICSSRILAKSQILLLLNGRDVLQSKMERGVSVKRYVPSFGDRTNDTSTVVQYFRQHFQDISKTCSPVPRSVHIHFTSATVSPLIPVPKPS
ncbi:guanine nucleotide binding protein, alpha subunit [Scleroderma yunnanense]